MWWFIIQLLLLVTTYVVVVADENVVEITILAFARNDPICAKLNQQYYDCSCDVTCENYFKPKPKCADCYSGSFCKENFALSGNICIRVEYCPMFNKQCPQSEHFEPCGCDLTCTFFNNHFTGCISRIQCSCETNEIFLPSVETNIIEQACPRGKICVKTCPGCFCHNGYFRDVTMLCIIC